MIKKTSVLLAFTLAISISLSAQEVTSKITNIYVDFFEDTPSVIVVSKPENFLDKTRGLKRLDTEFLEIEGTVNDEQGISSFFLNDDLIRVGSGGYFLVQYQLEEGVNTLSFVAIDSSQNRTEKVIEVEHKRNVHNGLISGNYYALLIGIENYDDASITDLDHPIGDSKKLYEVLTKNYIFEPENVHLVLDATRENMIDALDELSEKVTPNDNVLIFYAGHGIWDEDAEIGYWLPRDAREGSKSAWFRNSTLRDYIKEINSRHTLLIADACFSGSIFKSRSALKNANMATNKLYELPSRKAMTSGTLTEVPDKSIFMKFLIKRLEENKDQYVSSEQLFYKFKMAVINNGQAIPQYGTVQNAGDEGGDFIFIRKEK